MTLLEFLKSNNSDFNPNQAELDIAIDLEENREALIKQLKTGTIELLVNTLAYKENKMVHKHFILKGASILLPIVAIICFFFSWKIAISLLILAFISKIYSRNVLIKENKELRKLIINEFIVTSENKGLYLLWWLYVTGKISLRTERNISFRPSMPSECI